MLGMVSFESKINKKYIKKVKLDNQQLVSVSITCFKEIYLKTSVSSSIKW